MNMFESEARRPFSSSQSQISTSANSLLQFSNLIYITFVFFRPYPLWFLFILHIVYAYAIFVWYFSFLPTLNPYFTNCAITLTWTCDQISKNSCFQTVVTGVNLFKIYPASTRYHSQLYQKYVCSENKVPPSGWRMAKALPVCKFRRFHEGYSYPFSYHVTMYHISNLTHFCFKIT